jgi:hypothetical protein
MTKSRLTARPTITKMSIAVIAVSVLSLAVLAADLSGMWTMRLVTTGGAEAPTLLVTLKQDGEKLTGSCTVEDLDEILTLSGEAKDNEIRLQCAGTEVSVTLSGKVSEQGEMTGSWSTSTAAQGTFTATRTR